MINSVSGIPAIIIEKFDEVQTEVQGSYGSGAQSMPLKKSKEQENSLNSANELHEAKKDDEKGKQPSFKELAEKLHNLIDDSNLTIEFSLDKDTKKMIMKVLDSETKEIIRQFPAEITLKIARLVADNMESGNVTNVKV